MVRGKLVVTKYICFERGMKKKKGKCESLASTMFSKPARAFK